MSARERRPRVAWVGPLPPATSGIADYSADLLPTLAEGAELELFFEGEGERAVDPSLAARFPCRPVRALDAAAAATFDHVVYQIGNSPPHHATTYRTALEIPGVVVLHETMLHHLVRGLTLARGDGAAYREEMRYAAGRSGALAAQRLHDTHYPVDVWSFPLFERLVDRSRGVVVHSRFARARVLESRPLARVERVPMGIDLDATRPVSAEERAAIRSRLGLPAEAFVVGTFGFVTPQKRLEPSLAAFARLRRERSDARFAIVGEVSRHYDLDEVLARTGREGVFVAGRADAAAFRDWMTAVDVAVNLRHPTGGETSASLLRLLALGRPTIVNRTGSFAEVPEGACALVDLDAYEEATIAALLREFAGDPELGRRVGEAARRFVEREHSLASSASAYLDALSSVALAPMSPIVPVPPLAPYPPSDPWPALLARVGGELADLGIGEGDAGDEGVFTAVAARLAELRPETP